MYDIHHWSRRRNKSREILHRGVFGVRGMGVLTVDGNGHALSQDVAISAFKCGHLAELVELLVVLRHAVCRLKVHNVEVKVVGLGHSKDGRGARIALGETSACVAVEAASESCCSGGASGKRE